MERSGTWDGTVHNKRNRIKKVLRRIVMCRFEGLFLTTSMKHTALVRAEYLGSVVRYKSGALTS